MPSRITQIPLVPGFACLKIRVRPRVRPEVKKLEIGLMGSPWYFIWCKYQYGKGQAFLRTCSTMGLNMEKKKRMRLKTPMSLRPEAREKKQQHSPGVYARRHIVGWLRVRLFQLLQLG